MSFIAKTSPHDQNFDLEAYFTFLRKRQADLRRIARHSRGAYLLEDVESETLITAVELTEKTKEIIDFNNPKHQDLLIAYTYQKLVRYCEYTLNRASSLDQLPEESSLPTLITSISNGPEENPLYQLENEEDNHSADMLNLCTHTISGAWLLILDKCGNRMVKVAYFLKLSVSQSYRCYNRVVYTTQRQHDLPFYSTLSEMSLRPWRENRLYRKPIQLNFDFDYFLPLPAPCTI